MNTFNGSIPAAFGNQSRVQHLDASQLTGSIFPGITALVNQLTLDLSSNSLVGPIPREIGQLENKELLIQRQNGLSGSIPEEIGNLKLLKVLQLPGCKFTGTMSIGGLKSLKELDISENNFNSQLYTHLYYIVDSKSVSCLYQSFMCRNCTQLSKKTARDTKTHQCCFSCTASSRFDCCLHISSPKGLNSSHRTLHPML